jgi:D-threo-aldose 1-dehydrogenase
MGCERMNRLESRGVNVPQLGFGSAPIANLYGSIPETQAIETIQYAVQTGMNLIDTSPWYGAGLAETRVGLALQGVARDQYMLSTKVGHLLDGSGGFDFSREGVLSSLEASKKRLGVDWFDIVHLHDADDHAQEAIQSAFPVLAELRDQGIIKAIGAGANQTAILEQFANQADFDCFMLAGRYTLLEQTALGFLDVCQSKNIAVLLGGVFNSGILATGATANAKFQYANASPEILARVQVLEQHCQHHEIGLKAAALQFPMAHKAITTLVLGAVSPLELQQNQAAMQEEIPNAFWTDLQQNILLGPSPIPKRRNHE